MNSLTDPRFWACYAALPADIRRRAREAYRRWRTDPTHPGLQFKRIHGAANVYSVRVGAGWRALGVRDGDTVTWFWIGSHAEYDTLIS